MLFLLNKTEPNVMELISMLGGDEEKDVLLIEDAVYYATSFMVKRFKNIGVEQVFAAKESLGDRAVEVSEDVKVIDYDEMVPLIMEDHEKTLSIWGVTMSKTLTIMLLSGYQENQDPNFTVRLAEAVLNAGHKVNIFLFENAVNMANKEKPIEGKIHIQERLREYVDRYKIGSELEKLAKMGANIGTCHTCEYGRGTEAEEYRDGIQWGDVGETFTNYLIKSDVLLSLGH